jgi:hypothetical protein
MLLDGDSFDLASIIDKLEIPVDKFDIKKLSIKFEVGTTYYVYETPEYWFEVIYND